MELLNEKEIKELVEKYPFRSQDKAEMGEAVALYHFFIGSADWYVLEAGVEGTTPEGKDNITLFGLVNLHEVELGYFSLYEMETLTFNQKIVDENGQQLATIPVHIERDRYFKPTPLKDLQGKAIREYLELMGWT